METYRRPDGRQWTGQELDEATGGVVTRSYVTNLRKGRIDNPGCEKLRAIAKVMGFPPELWFQEGVEFGAGAPNLGDHRGEYLPEDEPPLRGHREREHGPVLHQR